MRHTCLAELAYGVTRDANIRTGRDGVLAADWDVKKHADETYAMLTETHVKTRPLRRLQPSSAGYINRRPVHGARPLTSIQPYLVILSPSCYRALSSLSLSRPLRSSSYRWLAVVRLLSLSTELTWLNDCRTFPLDIFPLG